MRHFLRSFYHHCWSVPESALDTLNSITASTWNLPHERLEQWISSRQRAPLVPEPIHPYRLYVLNTWLAFNFVRLTLYSILYQGNGISGQLHLPFYFGDGYQLLTAHSFYINVAAGQTCLYCVITSARFHLNRIINNQTSLKWYLVLVYVEAITRGTRDLRLFRGIPPEIYTRYRRKLTRILHMRALCIRGNRFFMILFFSGIVYRVYAHPEWNHPISAGIAIAALYQLFYNFWFQVVFNVQIILYLNSTFLNMLFDSVMAKFSPKSKKNRKNEKNKLRMSESKVRAALDLFDQSSQLLAEVNRFWRRPLSNFYFLFVPALMIAAYVLVFVPTDPLFGGTLSYTVVVCVLAMHANNWVAARVRITAQRLCRMVYNRGLVMAPNLTISTKIKIHNMTQLIGSKSAKFGIQIGSLGIANQRVTMLIIFIMVRIFMFLIKITEIQAEVEIYSTSNQ